MPMPIVFELSRTLSSAGVVMVIADADNGPFEMTSDLQRNSTKLISALLVMKYNESQISVHHIEFIQDSEYISDLR